MSVAKPPAFTSDFTESTVTSKLAYDGGLLKLNRDEVRLPDGHVAWREYVLHPGAVMMLAFVDDDTILLERQYRYPKHRHFIELPAGKLEPGEDPLATAKRELVEECGFEAEEINDFKGLNQKSKWYAFVMLVLMFSLTGLPPTAGFFAKLAVLQAAWESGFGAVVVFAVLMSVIGAFYYLRVVKVMYMDAPAGEITIDERADTRWTLTAMAVVTLVLGVMPGPLMEVCVRAITAAM